MENCEHKKIKIKFVGFYDNFDQKNNFITKILQNYYDVEISDNPEYLFYSVFSDEYVLYDCVRIFFTGENIAPNFQMCDYAIGFERLNYGDRYIRFPFYFGIESYKECLDKATHKHENINEIIKNNTEFCSFVYSNFDTDGMRNKLFEMICKYKAVNSGGKLLNTYNGKCVKDKFKFESKYKFSIACENSSHIGYSTEKIMQAFAAGTIPIYFGDPTITEEFNSKAFINCHEYNNENDLLARIVEIDNNPELYKRILSEPAFITNNYEEQQKMNLNKFLYNIFSQKLENAYRRNRHFWGAKYDAKYKRYYKYEKMLQILKKVIPKHINN